MSYQLFIKTRFRYSAILVLCVSPLFVGCEGSQTTSPAKPPQSALPSTTQANTEATQRTPLAQDPGVDAKEENKAGTADKQPEYDWPLFRGTPQCTGFTSGTMSDRLDLLWEFKVENGAFESTPTIVDNTVYIGDLDDRVFALDLSSGNSLWEFKTDIGFYAAPAVRDGRVFVGNMDGFFYCLNAKDGKLIWQFEAGATIDGGANFYKDNVIFGSQDAHLYCLDRESGELVWKHEIDDQIRCSPTVVENRAFVAGCDGVLHMIDLDNGESLGGVVIDSPTGVTPAATEQFAYFGTEQVGFYCVDWKTEKVSWNYQDPLGPASTRSNPAIAPGHVIFGARNRKVISLEPKTGEVNWQFEARGPIDSSPVIANDLVFIGADDRRMYILNLNTGEKIAERELNGKIIGSPALSNGKLIVATNRGVVYCLGKKE